mgnify:CR=1 FL=1
MRHGLPKTMEWLGTLQFNIRPGGYEYVVAHGYPAKNRCIDPNPHAVSQYGNAFATPTILLADRNALMQIAICSDHGSIVNRDIESMPKVETGAYLGIARYLQTISLTHTP